jgi:hypothetical protein
VLDHDADDPGPGRCYLARLAGVRVAFEFKDGAPGRIACQTQRILLRVPGLLAH